MADKPEGGETPNTTDTTETGESGRIKELNAEAAKHRHRANELAEKLEKLEADAAKRAEEEAAKRGEFQELYGKTKADLEALAPKTQTLESSLQKYLDAELEGISEDMQKLIPNVPITEKLEWVTTAKKQGLFKVEPPKPNTTSRSPGDNTAPIPQRSVDKIAAGLRKR